MFLKRLTIENLRSLEWAELNFNQPDGSTRDWTLLLGENGTGKSTLLRGAALVLAGSEALPHLLGPDLGTWVRYGADLAIVSADLETADGEPRKVSLTIPRNVGGVRDLYSLNDESLRQIDDAISHAPRNYLTLAYGSSRRLNSDAVSSAFQSRGGTPRSRAVISLFDPNTNLDPFEAWVIDQDYQSQSQTGPEASEGIQLISLIAGKLLPDVEFHTIDRVKKQILFSTPDGITPLNRLSDGYQNIAAWCGDLLRSMSTIFQDRKWSLKARGLLLIDEIDLHLHPLWQRRLREYLQETFPNLQVIATSHSPLTAQQCGQGELFFLRRKGKAPPVVEGFEGDPSRMMIHQLLMSPVFGLTTMDSLETEQKKRKLREMKNRKPVSIEEKRELRELRDDVSELPDWGAVEAYQKEHLRVMNDIDQALQSGGGMKKTKLMPKSLDAFLKRAQVQKVRKSNKIATRNTTKKAKTAGKKKRK